MHSDAASSPFENVFFFWGNRRRAPTEELEGDSQGEGLLFGFFEVEN